jgi:hypothetical protein
MTIELVRGVVSVSDVRRDAPVRARLTFDDVFLFIAAQESAYYDISQGAAARATPGGSGSKPGQGGGGSSGYDELVLQLKRTNLAKNQMEDTVVSLYVGYPVSSCCVRKELVAIAQRRCIRQGPVAYDAGG